MLSILDLKQLNGSLRKTNLLACVTAEHARLDYVEDHQYLHTRSKTFDTEVFLIPSAGLFLAAAGHDSQTGSAIYKWDEGEFRLFQNISTYEAQAWKYFTIGKRVGTHTSHQ